MRKFVILISLGAMAVVHSGVAEDRTIARVQPHKVALIVQNHAAPGARIPMAALTDALTAKLSGKGFQVINPYNAVGENENRTVVGEALPKVTAIELAQGLGADGAVTASVIEFLDTTTVRFARACGSTYDFSIPQSFMNWWPTCSVCDERAIELARQFAARRSKSRASNIRLLKTEPIAWSTSAISCSQRLINVRNCWRKRRLAGIRNRCHLQLS